MQPIAIITELERLYLNIGYPLVFLGSFLEVTPITWIFPAGIFVILGGFYSYGSSFIPLFGILVAGWLGEWAAFIATYLLGLKGFRFIKIFPKKGHQVKAKYLFEKHGALILSTSMMAGLTRFWIAYFAGRQKYEFHRFVFYSGVASLTWTALMVALGYLAGNQRNNLELLLTRLGIFGWLMFFIAIGVIAYLIKEDFKNPKAK